MKTIKNLFGNIRDCIKGFGLKSKGITKKIPILRGIANKAYQWTIRSPKNVSELNNMKGLDNESLLLLLRPLVQEIINNEIRVWGDRSRLKISPKAAVVNTLFNTSSGNIEIGDYTFTGHNVSIITGTHSYKSLLKKRMNDVPPNGRDIIIGKGVWICSNALILGPCRIGDHSVVAAGSVVTPGADIPPGSIVAGVPAKCIRTIPLDGKI